MWIGRRILENLFRNFQKQNRIDDDYTSMVAQSYGISDGINHLPISSLYRTMAMKSLINDNRINGYTSSSGHPLLTYGLQIYEKQLAGCDIRSDDFAKYVRVTVGATSAIHSFMMYHSNVHKYKKVIIAGMNYYLFERCCDIYNFEMILSIEEEGCMPLEKKLCNDINNNKKSIVILTQPSNPSGELYSEEEIRNIIKAVIHNNSILLLDICQMDELLGEPHYINVQKIIYEENAANFVVIVNSFSKTRGIAGSRIGYMVTNDKILADFVAYYNEMFYFNHSFGFENGIIVDLLYRTLLRSSEENKKSVIRSYRNLLLLTVGIEIYKKDFKDILSSSNIMEEAEVFRKEIRDNYKIIFDNYMYCLDFVGALPITKLLSGYNFCVKLPRKPEETERDFALKIENRIKSRVLTQEHFCCPAKEDADGIWIRISAALPKVIFEKHIKLLFDKE